MRSVSVVSPEPQFSREQTRNGVPLAEIDARFDHRIRAGPSRRYKERREPAQRNGAAFVHPCAPLCLAVSGELCSPGRSSHMFPFSSTWQEQEGN